jgi:hypothetical protein
MLVGAKSLIQESWKLYKNNFGLFAKIILWLLVPAVVSSLLPFTGLTDFILMPINFFVSLASAVLGIFVSVALILTIVGLYKKEEINLKNIYNLSYSKIVSCLWVSILSFAVALAAIFLSALPAILAFILREWLPAADTVLIIAYVISGVLFIISSVALGIWLSFGFYVVALENIKGRAALWYSKSMVKGYFWPVLWRWIAPYFIFMLVTVLINLLPTYLIGLITGSSGAGFAKVTPWWSVLISNIVYTFAIPLFAVAGVLLYNSLRNEKTTKTGK